MGIIQQVPDFSPHKPSTSSGSSLSDSDTASLTSACSSLGSTVPTDIGAPKKKNNNRRRRRGRKQNSNANNRQSSLRVPDLTPEQQSQYIAMDCEMVGVGRYGAKSALARVVLVDWHGEVALDRFILPSEPVTDYRTFVSGITPESLEGGMELATVREQVLEILSDKILVGHALKNDLHALQITHPWQYTRDTGKYEPFMKVRSERNDNVLWPRKLKELSQLKLQREIQPLGQAHSPMEDAIAALDLYKHAYAKWEKAMAWKIKKTREIEQAQQAQQSSLFAPPVEAQ